MQQGSACFSAAPAAHLLVLVDLDLAVLVGHPGQAHADVTLCFPGGKHRFSSTQTLAESGHFPTFQSVMVQQRDVPNFKEINYLSLFKLVQNSSSHSSSTRELRSETQRNTQTEKSTSQQAETRLQHSWCFGINFLQSFLRLVEYF